MKKPNNGNGVQSLNRTFDILEFFLENKDSVRIKDISHKLGLHKSTVHRILSAMARRGYIRQDRGFAIGATATLTDMLEHPGLAAHLDGVVAKMLGGVGSPLLRNAATIGGHLARGRYSDVVPVLLALDATITVFDGSEQIMPLAAYYAEGRRRAIERGLAERDKAGIKTRQPLGKFSIGNFQFSIDVFTTRIDTIFGVTALILAPEHELVSKIITPEHTKEVEEYISASKKKSEIERMDLEKEKTGVFTGSYAVNPVNGEKIPIWVADYVLISYGTGAIMAVPAHDERDWEFATKFKLPMVEVIQRPSPSVPLPR